MKTLNLFPCQDLFLKYTSINSREEREDFICFNNWRNENFLASAIHLNFLDNNYINCDKCDNIIYSDAIITFLPKHFYELNVEVNNIIPLFMHLSCFKCMECHQTLPYTHFYFDLSLNIYCGRHFAELCKPRCKTCDEIIFSKNYFKLEKDYWHLSHFICNICKTALNLNDKNFNLLNNNLFCCECISNKDNSQSNIYESIIDLNQVLQPLVQQSDEINDIFIDITQINQFRSFNSQMDNANDSDDDSEHAYDKQSFNFDNQSIETVSSESSDFMQEYRKLFNTNNSNVTASNQSKIGIYKSKNQPRLKIKSQKDMKNINKNLPNLTLKNNSKLLSFFDPRKFLRNPKQQLHLPDLNHHRRDKLCKIEDMLTRSKIAGEFQFFGSGFQSPSTALNSISNPITRNYFDFVKLMNERELQIGFENINIAHDQMDMSDISTCDVKLGSSSVTNKPLESISEIEEDIYKLKVCNS